MNIEKMKQSANHWQLRVPPPKLPVQLCKILKPSSDLWFQIRFQLSEGLRNNITWDKGSADRGMQKMAFSFAL